MNVSNIQSSAIQPTSVKKHPAPGGESAFEKNLKNVSSDSAPTREVQGQEYPAVLSQPEREYFEQLFPSSSEDIRSYNPYKRDNALSSVKLGSLFDRKG